MTTSPSLKTAALPQYLYSEEIGRRFRQAAHERSAGIARPKWSEEEKVIEESEKTADSFAYFFENKRMLETEFLEDLCHRIGDAQAHNFVNVVSVNWHFDHNSRPSQRLKASVRRYLQYLGESAETVDRLVVSEYRALPKPSFSPLEIELILETTHQMLFKHIGEWNTCRPESWRHSRDTVFLRRGLALREPFPKGHLYREWDFINAYSLTVSVPEKFSLEDCTNAIPAIITADLDYLDQCILFFSPFILNMPTDQLEAGVIPGFAAEPLAFHGKHRGIHEYYLAPHEPPQALGGGTNRGRANMRPARRNPAVLGIELNVDDEHSS